VDKRRFKVDPAENDVTNLRQSFADFNLLVQRFPSSRFSADAQRRMMYIRNILAQNELDAAQFYFRQKAYVAAANRATNIVEHYQQAPQVIDALVILVQANRALGLDKPANQALQVLKTNYPNSSQARKL
jgi:outer membrane protein assembly factor BamD